MRRFKLVCFAISVILFAIVCAVFIIQNPEFFSPETEIRLNLHYICLGPTHIKFFILVLLSFFLGLFVASFLSLIVNFRGNANTIKSSYIHAKRYFS
ncbi:MAG TPA: hypothetical protein EYP21_05175 [Syntrophaceae bacterium]|nr:hypothetical protein [Syntrophaceae bacterium]